MKTNREKVINKTGIMKTLIYPQNLDLETLYLNNGYSINIRKNMIIRTLKIVSKLTPTNYNSYRFNKKGYVHLSSRYKKKVLGNYYTDFHNEMMTGENPIIEMSSRYKVGMETKLYRLTPKFRKSKIEKFHIEENNIKNDVATDFLSDQFYKDNIRFDKDVFTYLFNFYKEIETKMDNDKQKVLLKNYIGRNLCIIDDICNNDMFFGRSKSNYRYYSSLTSINRIIRPFILVNNNPLISIDIKSSQPYILASILDSSFYNINKVYNINKIRKGIGGIILFPRFLKGKERGIEKYRSISFDKDFYSIVLRKEFGREPTKIERETLKQKTMQFLFYNNSKAREKNELNYLVKQYPAINSIITSFLNIIGERDFSFLLQRSESLLVIDIISKEFNEKFPKEPLFTLHDCIITTEQHKLELTKVMFEVLYEKTDIKPGLSVKKLDPSDPIDDSFIKEMKDDIIKKSTKSRFKKMSWSILDKHIETTNEFLKNN